MSHYWEIIAPVAVVAFGVVVLLARRLRRQTGEHRTGRGWPDDGIPDVRAATVPVATVAGLPPWAPAGEARGPGSLGTWFPHDSYDPGLDWAARNELLPPGLEATLRRELHHVDMYEPDDLGPGAGLFLSPGYNSRPAQSRMVRMKADSPAPAGLPREDGAGDESEACGPPAPPAPLRPVDLALARCDLFMVAMRADHERWMAGARERWAAA